MTDPTEDAAALLSLHQPETQPFRDAAAEGRFLLPHCRACSRAHWYPRALCPFCGGAVDWREASGGGTIYAVSVMRRADPPYALAFVTLDEGPTMMTNLVDCDIDRAAIGQAVRVTFRDWHGVPVPMFTTA
ncbi:MAG: Zn-ribbon domain-containing OB-fold protein [Alphaproteobacteria bacterium]